VGERGILIDLIDSDFKSFRDLVNSQREELTEKNFKWAQEMTWKKSALKLLE